MMGYLLCFILGAAVGSLVVYLIENPDARTELRELFRGKKE